MPSDITESSTYLQQLNYIAGEIDSPKRVSVDGVDVTNRSMSELIAAMRFKRSAALFPYGLGACMIHQARPPNARGTNSGAS